MVVPSLPLIERSLWFLNIVFCAILAARLYYMKLARTYRAFFLYLLFIGVRGVITWNVDPASGAYINIWKATQPAIWILYALVVLELSFLIFREYRGIQVLGRWTVYSSLAASVVISLIILAPTWRQSGEPMLSTPRFLMVERGIDSALVLLLLLLLVFLALLPIPLNRNVIIHSVLYTVFFMAGWMGILIVDLTSFQMASLIGVCLMGVAVLCQVSWILLLSREGEEKIAVFRKPLPAAYEHRLIEQLSSINATLLRASSKVDSATLTR
jgi:hypothetical protein